MSVKINVQIMGDMSAEKGKSSAASPKNNAKLNSICRSVIKF